MKTYPEVLLDYFFHLEHVGVLDQQNYYCVQDGSIEQGDITVLCVQIKNDLIESARFKCYGGVALLAACEYVCRWLEGKPLQKASYLTAEHILSALNLSRLHIHIAVRIVGLIKKLLLLF